MNRLKMLFISLVLFSGLSVAAEPVKIRLGVLASGTLAWELTTLKNEGLLKDAGFVLDSLPLTDQQAGKIALQAGSVDMIVSDWIWVSTMRAQGQDYTFYPYSASAGGLLVPANSNIKIPADLQGKKLGIAGGELDKNWALLQALGQQQQLDLNQSVEKVFGAPPLLSQQLSSQRIDALLTYWQFAARLQAQGYRQILSGEEMIRQLGITETVPSLGYVFKQSWANQHQAALQQFFAVTQTAKDRLCESDQTWQNIVNLTETEDTATQQQLRAHYCQGRIKQWDEKAQKAAEAIYQHLHQLKDHKLTAKNPQLQPGTFWSAD